VQPDELNPAQEELAAALAHPGGRIEFPPELRASLNADLEHQLAPIAARLGQDPLYLNKHTIATAAGCEERFLAERAEKFSWSAPKARGTVAHKAIELGANMAGHHEPPVLVDEAIAVLQQERGLGEWLQECGDVTRAEIRSASIATVASFQDIWFPLTPRHSATFERRVARRFCDQAIVLTGKMDLTLGSSRTRESRMVVIDLKSGRVQPDHRADLRIYALLIALETGVPPRLLASSYLDSAELHTEVVTEDLLWSQVRRVVDAAGRIVTLITEERDPTRQTGTGCWYCPKNQSCDDGQAWMAEADDR